MSGVFFFKQKTAYEMRISDWSSDVCSSDLEAIRPTDLFRRPQDVARALDDDHRRLYELIWKRTVACEMESAVLDQMAVDITSPDRQEIGRASCRERVCQYV